MLKHKDHFHGSDLETIEALYGIKKEDITSFSANVNPLGLSPLLRQSLIEKIDCITSYPDREYTSLRRCIAAYAGTAPENVVVGNGSSELIALFIQLEHPKKALIVGPTYSEYERAVALEGGTSLYYPLREENDFCLEPEELCRSLDETIDLLILCNPNNPTSTSISMGTMRQILDTCKRFDIRAIVDETYVEFVPDSSAVTSVPLTNYYNNLIILRGVSKFFAAPGLRLGYAVTGDMDLIKCINTQKNPWAINSLAAAAGECMFTDTAYIQKTRSLIQAERERCFLEMSALPSVKAYAPTANFMLLQIRKEGVDAQQLFEHAIRQGMMIRNCSSFPFLDNRYIRFCFMKPEKNTQLLDCLKELL